MGFIYFPDDDAGALRFGSGVHHRHDGEPLTDLLTVFLGLGIFTANAAHEFAADSRGWSARRLGYMTEQMFGYALARYALHRGERDPAWAEHLDLNPRTYMRQTFKSMVLPS